MLFRSEVYSNWQGSTSVTSCTTKTSTCAGGCAARLRCCLFLPSARYDARRESRRSLRHLRWHLASMLRFMVTR
jgi:hypothetical protein